MRFSLESWNVRPVRRAVRDGVSIVRMREGLLGASESGRLLGGHLLRVVMRSRNGVRVHWPLRGGAYGVRRGRRRRVRGGTRTDGRGRHCPHERHERTLRACARRGTPGVRLSDRRVVTSGDGVGRVRASDGGGAKPRRRYRRMRDRNSDAGQQPCDGRYEIRHDFPDPLDDCLSPASSRSPVQCRCLHRCISKQRASVRTAALTRARRSSNGYRVTAYTRKCFSRETRRGDGKSAARPAGVQRRGDGEIGGGA